MTTYRWEQWKGISSNKNYFSISSFVTRTFGRHGRGHLDVMDTYNRTSWTRTFGRHGHGHSEVMDTDIRMSWTQTFGCHGHGHSEVMGTYSKTVWTRTYCKLWTYKFCTVWTRKFCWHMGIINLVLLGLLSIHL